MTPTLVVVVIFEQRKQRRGLGIHSLLLRYLLPYLVPVLSALNL